MPTNDIALRILQQEAQHLPRQGETQPKVGSSVILVTRTKTKTKMIHIYITKTKTKTIGCQKNENEIKTKMIDQKTK